MGSYLYASPLDQPCLRELRMGLFIGLPSERKRCLLLLLLVVVHHLHETGATEAVYNYKTCGYPAIFNFGDSISDTGNRAFQPDHVPSYCIDPPYGMTFFGRPTGRCSDGRLIVDFIAEKMGLPYLPPYLVVYQQAARRPQLLRQGVNFAVAGSTAMNASFFEDQGIETQTNRSLAVQLHWFKTLLPFLCPNGTRNCNLLARSLFLVGEIGGNDLNYLFFDGRSVNEVRAVFPRVIDAISATIQDLIRSGARTLVIPGNFPLGCNVAYQRLFPLPVDGGSYYDPDTGCIRWLNSLAEDFNRLLQEELDRLRRGNPHAAIVYADYYGAAMPFFLNPARYGFTKTLEACCGSYNATIKKRLKCGDKKAGQACNNASQFVSWDGMHMTEASYRVISTRILNDAYKPSISRICKNSLMDIISHISLSHALAHDRVDGFVDV